MKYGPVRRKSTKRNKLGNDTMIELVNNDIKNIFHIFKEIEGIIIMSREMEHIHF